MIQVVFVNSHGEVKQWCSPAFDNMYTNGSEYNGLTAIHVASDLDVAEYIKTNVYVSGAWTTRTAQPTGHYIWESGAWVFQQTEFDGALRAERNRRLAESDWTQAADSPLTDAKKAEWVTYRTTLRDLPLINEATNLDDVIWPTRP